MDEQFKQVLADTCRKVLRPIAKLLLKCGMTWKEFAELSKLVFVEMATSEFGIKGRPTNISRVSILTGISRKEVKRQRDLLATSGPTETRKTTDATRVLAGWHQDAAYLDASGNPAELSVGGTSPSFESLFSRYGGDVSQAAMLKELVKTGAVKYTEEGHLKALSRYYQPVQLTPESITEIFGKPLSDLATVVEHDITRKDTDAPDFQGYADDDRIDAKHLDEFRAMLDSEGQHFLEKVDRWLASHRLEDSELSSDGSRSHAIRLGVGVYAINQHSQ